MTDEQTARRVAERLRGTMKQYTVTVHLKNGKSYSVQANSQCYLSEYDHQSRECMMKVGEYPEVSLFHWADVEAVTMQPNEAA